jgi:hypothetical protein
MNLRKPIAAALAALSIGVAGGVLAGTADATIGPFGGRYITAQAPTKYSNDIYGHMYISGNGGVQTVNYRLMVLVGGVWTHHGDTRSMTTPSGYIAFGNDISAPCAIGSHTYRTEAKWASYSWAQADKSGSASFTC